MWFCLSKEAPITTALLLYYANIVPLNNLVLLSFIYPSFNDRILSYAYFYCFLCMSISVLQKQRISFLRSLKVILDIFHFQYTRTCLYCSGKMLNKRAFVSYSSFSYFSLVLLNFRFKLYSSLGHMSGSWLVYLIIHVFHLLVNPFRPYFFSPDN